MTDIASTYLVSVTVNGRSRSARVEARTFLVEFLREHLELTGTHVGCDTCQCGCCTVLVNGDAVKSCTMLALQADGAEIKTIEGLAAGDELHPVQRAFHEHHALQCGYCTPGFVMSAVEMISKYRDLDEEKVRALADGNMCRCTGYHNIVKAILAAARSAAGNSADA